MMASVMLIHYAILFMFNDVVGDEGDDERAGRFRYVQGLLNSFLVPDLKT